MMRTQTIRQCGEYCAVTYAEVGIDADVTKEIIL